MNDFSQVSPNSFTASPLLDTGKEVMFSVYGFKGHETRFIMYEE